MKEIKIGDEMFFCNLGAFRMADNTTQIESRITKVKILGIYNYVDSETIYLFKIGPGEFQSTEERLHTTELAAKAFATDKIMSIAIVTDMQEEGESVASVDGKNHRTATED